VPGIDARVSGRISSFNGIKLSPDFPWRVGFINSRKAWVYSAPSRKTKFRIGKVSRYTPFRVLETVTKGNRHFFRFDENAWLSSIDVRVQATAPVPKEVTSNEKWIDVDTKEQIITAYEGNTPVYVSLASTGRDGPSHTTPGKFRIWAKVAAIAMDNTDEQLEEDLIIDAGIIEERKLYSLHDVPWAQFFFENYAMHGVYWHDGYGNRRSHGCVNLSPIDARWFFDWTEPHLPDGWWAIHSSSSWQGTLVQVR
jgi:lipoprotein-anchoring transpeptidase ErfK/SrfK